MFAHKLISRKACRPTRSKNTASFSVGYLERCVRFVYDFIALGIMESVLTFHDYNFCKFHVLYACTGDACALETRRQFVTERGKEKKNGAEI